MTTGSEGLKCQVAMIDDRRCDTDNLGPRTLEHVVDVFEARYAKRISQGPRLLGDYVAYAYHGAESRRVGGQQTG